MGMTIATNTTALNAWRNLDKAQRMFSTSMEKLSSGYRINRAADDPAGLVLSEKLRAQIVGLDQGVRNTQDAVSMIQTAEGALTEMHSLLDDMRALALHSANTGVVDTASVAADQNQVDQAIDSLNRIAQNTIFAGKSLLDGSAANVGTVVNHTLVAGVEVGAHAPTTASYVDVDVSAAATVGTTTITLTGNSISGAGDITVNGLTISLASGDNATSAATKIQAALDAGGIEVNVSATSTSAIIFNTQSYGASFTVTVEDTDGALNGTSAASFSDSGSNISGKFIMGGDDYTATGDGLTLTGNSSSLEDVAVTITTAGNTVAATTNAFYIESGVLSFQVGSETTDSVTTTISNMQSTHLGASAGGAGVGLNSIKTNGIYALGTDPSEAVDVIDEAIQDVSNERAKLGSLQKYVLESKISSLNVAKENVAASESRIRDVDMASETTNFTKNQILMQAATAMLVQANSAPQAVLSLLRG